MSAAEDIDFIDDEMIELASERNERAGSGEIFQHVAIYLAVIISLLEQYCRRLFAKEAFDLCRQQPRQCGFASAERSVKQESILA